MIHNPHPYPVKADLLFGLRAGDRRSVTVRAPGKPGWTATLEPGVLRTVGHAGVRFPPGSSEIKFDTDQGPAPPRRGDPRSVAFSLRDLRVRIVAAGGP